MWLIVLVCLVASVSVEIGISSYKQHWKIESTEILLCTIIPKDRYCLKICKSLNFFSESEYIVKDRAIWAWVGISEFGQFNAADVFHHAFYALPLSILNKMLWYLWDDLALRYLKGLLINLWSLKFPLACTSFSQDVHYSLWAFSPSPSPSQT